MLNVWDYERAAAERLDPGALGYLAGSAGDELTLAENLAATRRWRLRPRVLVDVSEVTTATTLLGTPSSNHGGRQVDGVAATIDLLPEVVDAVDGRVEVLTYGGVRRGADVARALALGASHDPARLPHARPIDEVPRHSVTFFKHRWCVSLEDPRPPTATGPPAEALGRYRAHDRRRPPRARLRRAGTGGWRSRRRVAVRRAR